ncbi:MAG: pyridoxal-phosphate dependent enzyme [Deltaproteobacteria bacterium]|nr:pyridoxal-phosphate dependent enzyme [Deltaproteobacteria bacterium]
MPHLGRYPTPVTELTHAAAAAGLPRGALLAKRDDLTSDVYGGNKVRKLERLLEEAKARGARRVVTIGAIGSHHVLATAIFGRAEGFEVDAILAPQTDTPHAEKVARVGATLGYTAYPVGSFAAVPLAVARRMRRGAYLIPPGGSSVTGSLGFVDAGLELAEQIARGELPRPASVVVALGSGGTAAGLLVGLEQAGLLVGSGGAPPVELVAVQVVDPPFGSAAHTLSLALAIRRRMKAPLTRAAITRLSQSLRVVRAYLGHGYGSPTPEGEAATMLAARDGLTLDPTYTAKTFAAAVEEARTRRVSGPVLFWMTLSATGPFERLLSGAPPLDALDPRLRRLLRAAAPQMP